MEQQVVIYELKGPENLVLVEELMGQSARRSGMLLDPDKPTVVEPSPDNRNWLRYTRALVSVAEMETRAKAGTTAYKNTMQAD